MGKQDDSYFGIVHRAEQAQLKAERSPASNTPTPELVERLRKEIPYNADGFRELRDLADEAAAAIAKLTAERDAQYDENVNRIAAEGAAILRAEAAEKRVKELDAKLKRITAIGEDNLEKLKSYIDATPAIEAANKLLSKRVAVLEAALEPFAKSADRFISSSTDTDHWKLNQYSDVTYGDIRRASHVYAALKSEGRK